MSTIKTKANDASVTEFLDAIEQQQKREDGYKLLELFESATGYKAQMWGDSLIGFGWYHYKYSSGQEADWPLTAFSPRKANISIYIMPGFDHYKEQLDKIGKYKNSVACLYIKKLEDIDLNILKEMIIDSVAKMKETYPQHSE